VTSPTPPPPRVAAGAPTPASHSQRPKVWFVGAGPGAADLLTFRGAAAIAAADVVVWAGSLVSAEVLVHARAGAELLDSSRLTLEQVTATYDRAVAGRLVVARVHSGDPTLYGAIQEQIAECDRRGLPWEIVPGVSSLAAAAAAVGRELTIPGVAQSVVLTRLATRTSSSMPPRERVRELARSGSTMALFLSCSRPRALQAELEAGGYPPDTPCAVVYRASWPDEVVIRCRLTELANRIRRARISKQALVLVGPVLAGDGGRSHLYHPAFSHSFRRAEGREQAAACPGPVADEDEEAHEGVTDAPA
jgi:precorrin-4/cobalt-precorrin-4 C11-methyltransferase